MFTKEEKALNQRSLDKAKVALLVKPNTTFFTSLCFKLAVEFRKDISTAATDYVNIFLNPELWHSSTKEQQIFILVHETLHVAYDHLGRSEGRDKAVWNKACDYVINLALKDSGFELFDWVCCDEAYRGMSAEEVYRILEQNPEEHQEPDMEDLLEPAEENADVRTAKAKQMIAEAVVAAKHAKDYSSIPDSIKRYLDEALNPRIPWNIVFKRAVSKLSKSDYSWSKQNMRYAHIAYLPSLHSQSLGKVSIAIDTSGSVSQKDFSACMVSISHVLKQYKPNELELIQFDHQIESIKKVKNLMDLRTLDLLGGGGTEIKPVIDQYIGSKSKLLVILTDGYFYAQNLPNPNKPVFWLIYNNSEFKPPFGTVIHFDM